MIVIQGQINSKDFTLISKIKKYFEVDEVVFDWNGKDDVNTSKKTLVISSEESPYTKNCNVINLETVKILLQSETYHQRQKQPKQYYQ